MSNTVYDERIAALEASIDAASCAVQTATMLSTAQQRGEPLSDSSIQQVLGQIIRRSGGLEILGVAWRSSSGFAEPLKTSNEQWLQVEEAFLAALDDELIAHSTFAATRGAAEAENQLARLAITSPASGYPAPYS